MHRKMLTELSFITRLWISCWDVSPLPWHYSSITLWSWDRHGSRITQPIELILRESIQGGSRMKYEQCIKDLIEMKRQTEIFMKLNQIDDYR